MDYGKLRVYVTTESRNLPIEGATVRITNENEPENTIEEVNTDQNGQTPEIELEAPPIEYSMQPGQINHIQNTRYMLLRRGMKQWK